MNDLIEFLRARLDEDAETAKGMESSCWHADYCDDAAPLFHDRFDEDRVLADVGAKLRIINEYVGADFTRSCHPEYESNNGYVDGLAFTLRLLALPYASHPDYWDGWKP